MQTEFPDVKPFPADETAPDQHHNEPPLEERLTMQFDDALYRKGLPSRVAEITDAATRAPDPITGDDDAGAVGDLLAQAKAARAAVDAEREVLNRPLLNAQRALKGKADGLVLPMDKVLAPLRERLDAFMGASDTPVHGDMGARVVLVIRVRVVGRLGECVVRVGSHEKTEDQGARNTIE